MRPNLGLLALLVALVGLLTGPFLALHYAPTIESARTSLAHLEQEVALGKALRGLHHWAGNLALILATLHGLRLFLHGRYKPPRQRLWVLGGLVLLVLLACAHTGYLLAGDERARAGLEVVEGVARSTPVVGPAAARLLVGGDSISSATLVRLHAVHTIFLPVALALLVWVFLREWRLTDFLEPAANPPPEPGALLARDAAWAILACLLLALGATLLPAPLGPKADLAGGSAPDARPEWFFLWINQLLRVVPAAAWIPGALVPGCLALAGLGLPWLLRAPEASPRRRLPELVGAALLVAGLVALSLLSQSAPATEAVAAGARADAGALDEQASAAMRKFQCRSCHVIDGDSEGGVQGPPLDREGFGELFTRAFFARKVGDPVGFWADTNMRYTPMRLKPTAEELAALEWWFFGGG